jgi:hypothetical protein
MATIRRDDKATLDESVLEAARGSSIRSRESEQQNGQAARRLPAPARQMATIRRDDKATLDEATLDKALKGPTLT